MDKVKHEKVGRLFCLLTKQSNPHLIQNYIKSIHILKWWTLLLNLKKPTFLSIKTLNWLLGLIFLSGLVENPKRNGEIHCLKGISAKEMGKVWSFKWKKGTVFLFIYLKKKKNLFDVLGYWSKGQAT